MRAQRQKAFQLAIFKTTTALQDKMETLDDPAIGVVTHNLMGILNGLNGQIGDQQPMKRGDTRRRVIYL